MFKPFIKNMCTQAFISAINTSMFPGYFGKKKYDSFLDKDFHLNEGVVFLW